MCEGVNLDLYVSAVAVCAASPSSLVSIGLDVQRHTIHFGLGQRHCLIHSEDVLAARLPPKGGQLGEGEVAHLKGERGGETVSCLRGEREAHRGLGGGRLWPEGREIVRMCWPPGFPLRWTAGRG